MRPIQTADSTMVMAGPEGVGDLYAQRLEDGSIASVWWLTDEERQAIADGANIALVVAAQAHPVVALCVVDVAGVDEDDPDVRARLELLRRAARG